MATIFAIGNALATTDTWTFTPGALGVPPTSNFFTITRNGKSYTFTCGASDTVATVCAGLIALTGVTTAAPEFAEYTWTATATAVTATRNTPGIPATFTVSKGNGGGAGTPTFVVANTIAASGPNDAANVLNYSGGALPINGDTLVLDSQSPALLWNLNVLSAVTLAVYDAQEGFPGPVGLPPVNPAGYQEDRPTSMAVGATILRATAAASLRINVAGVQTAAQCRGSTLQLIGTNAANTLDISGGSVDVSKFAGDAVSQFATITQSAGQLHCYSRTTIASPTQAGGQSTYDNGFTGTFLLEGGQSTVNGQSLNAAALTVSNATCILNASGATLAALTANVGGTIDKSQDIAPLTVTTKTLNGGSVIDPANALGANYVKGTTTRSIQAA